MTTESLTSLRNELNRLSYVSDTEVDIVNKLSSHEDVDINLKRILVSDLQSIVNHHIESLAKLNKVIRSLKKDTFSFAPGETKESIKAALDRVTAMLNA